MWLLLNWTLTEMIYVYWALLCFERFRTGDDVSSTFYIDEKHLYEYKYINTYTCTYILMYLPRDRRRHRYRRRRGSPGVMASKSGIQMKEWLTDGFIFVVWYRHQLLISGLNRATTTRSGAFAMSVANAWMTPTPTAAKVMNILEGISSRTAVARRQPMSRSDYKWLIDEWCFGMEKSVTERLDSSDRPGTYTTRNTSYKWNKENMKKKEKKKERKEKEGW